MIKVLLLNPPFAETLVRDNYCCHTSKGNYAWAPSDLLYVSGNLNDIDIDLRVTDAIIERKNAEVVLADTLKFLPDVIIALSGSTSFFSDIELLQKIKNQINCRIYLMGNLPVFNAEKVLQEYSFVDGMLHNFFDTKILELVKNPLAFSKSISARNPDGSIHLGEVNYLERKELPLPRVPRHDLFPNHLYSTPISLHSPMTTVITAFGCPYDCKFCVASELNLYNRPIENLEAELDAAKAIGIRELFFMDSTFNTSPSRVREICELMMRKGYGFTWSCNVHSLKNSQEDFLLMKKAGCHTVQIGVEAGNEISRKEFAPTKSRTNLKEVFDRAHAAGLRTLGYFIVGFPEEGFQEVNETIDYAIELNPHFASFTTLMPDYGTEFYREAREKNMVEAGLHPFDNSGKPLLNKMKLTIDEREQLLKSAYKKFYLRPSQLYKYLTDFALLPVYLKNGRRILRKFIS